MKNVLIFSTLIIIGICLFFGYQFWFHNTMIETTISPLAKSQFSLESAPTLSLRGNIASFSGLVNWQSRTATQAARLTKTQVIQQGEEVATENNGNIIIGFPQIASVSAIANTSLNFIQTLPANIVIAQDSGLAQYTSVSNIPLSVRSLDLLVNVTQAVITVSVNDTTVTVTVLRGLATAAYEDSQNNSTVITIPTGNEFVFDNDAKRGEIQ